MFCPKCGKEIAQDAMFCKHCGHYVSGTGNGGNRMTGTVPQRHSPADYKGLLRKYGKYLIAVAGLIIVIILGKSLLSCSSGDSYKGIVDKYMNAMKSCDVQGVLACLPESEQRNSNTVDLVTRELIGGSGQTGIIDSPYEVKYQIGSTEKMTEADMEFYSRNGEEVVDGYYITVTVSQSLDGITIEGEAVGGAIKRSKDYTLLVGKIGRKWYVLRYMEFTYYT